MATVAELVAVLRANTTEFTAGMEKANTQLAATATGAKSMGALASKAIIGLGVAAVAASVLAVGAFKNWALSTLTLQRVTGQTAEDASKLLFVGQELGVGVDKMNIGFGLLAKNIANNATNLLKYGIQTQTAGGRQLSFNTILGEAADKYLALGGGMAGAAFAMNVFGRSGKSLIPILAQGSAGIAKYMSEAEKFGLVLSQTDVESAKQFAIAERSLGEAARGAGVSLGRVMLPVVQSVIEWVTKGILLFQKLPVAVVASVLKFFALAGAIMAVVKIGGIFVRFFAPMVGLLVKMAVGAYGYAASLISLAASEGIAATASMVLEGALALLPPVLVVATIALFVAALYEMARGEGAVYSATKVMADQVVVFANAAKLSARTGISFGSALAIVRGEASAASKSFDSLTQAMGGFDPTAILSMKAVDAIGSAMPSAGRAMDQFAKVTGISMDSIKSSYADLVTNSKATGADYLAVIASMKQAQQQFKQQTIDAFGGSGGALDQFANKSNVDLGQAIKALKGYQRQIGTFQSDIQKIQATYGKKANAFINWASQQGLAQAGLVHSVARGTKQLGNEFVSNFNKGNKATSGLANVIAHVLVPKFDLMIQRLTQIAVKMGAIPPPKIDNSQAMGALRAVQNALNSLSGQHVNVSVIEHTLRAGIVHQGGMVMHSGGIASDERMARLQVGEFVMRRSAVRRIGIEPLRAMNEGRTSAGGVGADGMVGDLRVLVRPDRRRLNRDLDADMSSRGW